MAKQFGRDLFFLFWNITTTFSRYTIKSLDLLFSVEANLLVDVDQKVEIFPRRLGMVQEVANNLN